MNAQEVIDKMEFGRAMLTAEGGDLLMDCIREVGGDYIEIGSAFGGSALMAASAGANMVYCIDPFLGLNTFEGLDSFYNSFLQNMYFSGFMQKVIMFRQSCPPFPEPIHFHEFAVGLIDGCHLGDAPGIDLIELHDRVTDYLLFDNAEAGPVAKVIKVAIGKGAWEMHKEVDYKSTASDTAGMKKIVALHRTCPPEKMTYYEKLKFYYPGGSIPLY